MRMKWILVLLAASVATGCATKKELIQDYPGEALPAERIALIRPSGLVYINAIDANYDIQTKGVDAQIAVLPVSHTVSARLNTQGISVPAPPISLNTRPGGKISGSCAARPFHVAACHSGRHRPSRDVVFRPAGNRSGDMCCADHLL